jgi:hypothetical protein
VNRRELLQSIVQAILFALFGKRAQELPAHIVDKVMKFAEQQGDPVTLLKGGLFKVTFLIKGFELHDGRYISMPPKKDDA